MKTLILSLFAVNFVCALDSLSNNCGLLGISRTVGRIVGGRIVERGEFPWTVALQELRNGTEFQHFCGAAVISDRWLVTAAHCLQRKNLVELRAVLGTVDLDEIDEKSFITEFEKIVIHVDYEFETFRNDIALLRTKKPIPISSSNLTINQICLPKDNQTFSGRVTTSGWGRVNEYGFASSLLLTVDIRLFDDAKCKEFYRKAFYPNMMLCAGLTRGGKDACQGDSGGPLQKEVEGRVYLVGIVSFGEGCARKMKPSIYTKISHYAKWINSIIGTANSFPTLTTTNEEIEDDGMKPTQGNIIPKPHIKLPIPQKPREHDVFVKQPVVITKNRNNDCGIRKDNSLYRIIGGRPALDTEFPWTVSLVRKSGSHFCGAAVLTDRWIITAAHCMHRRSAKSVNAVFGTTNLRSKSASSFTTTIEEVVEHPAFKYSGLANDIALLKTKDTIPNFSENHSVNKICLPNINTTLTGSAYVSGWGGTKEEGDFNDFLKVLLVKIYNDYECSVFYGKKFNSETMICAGYNQGGSDACTGDSGGPLEQVVDKRSYLIGLVSFGVGCARPNLPGVYTKLSSYVDWIQSIIGKNETKKAFSPVIKKTPNSPKPVNAGKMLTTGVYFKQIPNFCPRLCDQLCNSLQ